MAGMIAVDASWVVALRDPLDAHHGAAVASNDAMGDEPALLALVTFAECLVAPAKMGVLDEAAAELRAAFDVIGPDADAALRWAALRAETGLRLPDTIVLDVALQCHARAIATFDGVLALRARERGLEILG
jgi:predicted nucleic acid-binding protein